MSGSTSDAVVEDEKLAIFNFYKTLSIKLIKTFSVGILEVFASIGHLMSNYKLVNNGILPTEIDYTKKKNCIAYLYRYAACHTALVFDVVSKILDSSSSSFLTSKLNKKNLNVVFLGGGPGNDFVGFLTALHSHLHHLLNLDVTIVDKMSGWKDVFNETIKSLRRGNGGKAGSIFEKVNVKTSFVLADLKDSDEWDEIMKAKLRKADIVFLVKVLSHIPDDDKRQVLQNIVTSMQAGSLLIFIDNPFPERAFASLSGYLRTVYQSCKAKYILNYEDCTFLYSSNGCSTAVVKAFEICESDLLSLLISRMIDFFLNHSR